MPIRHTDYEIRMRDASSARMTVFLPYFGDGLLEHAPTLVLVGMSSYITGELGKPVVPH